MIKFYVGQIIVGIIIGVVVYYLTWGRRKNHENSLENNTLYVDYIQELVARQQAEDRARSLQSGSERRPLALTHTNDGEYHDAETQNGYALSSQHYDKGWWWDNQPTNNSVGIVSPPSLDTNSMRVSQTVEPQPPVISPDKVSIRAEQESAMRRNQLPQGVLFTKLPNETESDQALAVTTTINSLTIGKVFTADPNLADDQQPRIPESRYSLPSDSIFKVSPQQPTQQIAPSRKDHPENRALALPSAQDHTSSPPLRRKRSLPDVSKLNIFGNKKAKE